MSASPQPPTLFERILRREIPATFVHEDDLCFAIRDIAPKAPTHVLVIPRKPLPGVQSAAAEDQDLLGHLLLVARAIAEREGIAAGGFRLVINAGPDAGQAVPHLHVHVLGGRALGWPPG